MYDLWFRLIGYLKHQRKWQMLYHNINNSVPLIIQYPLMNYGK